MPLYGVVKLTFQLADTNNPYTAYVADLPYKVLIGFDFMNDTGAHKSILIPKFFVVPGHQKFRYF